MLDPSTFTEENFKGLVFALSIPMVIASISGYIIAKNMLWFMSLLQSNYTPSPKVIRYGWTMSYTLQGIASFMIWKTEQSLLCTPLILYAIQLFCLALHTPVFFALKRQDIALVVSCCINMFLIVCIFSFFQSNVIAGFLMIPYFGWLLFTSAVNADFYRLKLGQQRDPVYFTTNYSPHHLYQSTLEKQKVSEDNNHTTNSGTFYSKIPDIPEVKPINFPNKKMEHDGPIHTSDKPLRFRFPSETPPALYVP